MITALFWALTLNSVKNVDNTDVEGVDVDGCPVEAYFMNHSVILNM